MSTKVSILDIMRAFHRWDPMDVKQLFAEELSQEMSAKDKQIESLTRQVMAYEIICGPNGAKELMDNNIRIESLEGENRLIRLANSKLFSEGQALIRQLNGKLNDLQQLLDDSKNKLDSKQKTIKELMETNADLKQKNDFFKYHLVIGCGKGYVSDQSMPPKDLPQNYLLNGSVSELSVQQKINEIIASNRQFARRLIKTLVLKIIALKTQNSNQIKEKNDLISQNNNQKDEKSEDLFSNEVLEQIESEDNFENFFNRFKTFFVDKSMQTMEELRVSEVLLNN